MSGTATGSGDGIDVPGEERVAIDHYDKLTQTATFYEILGVAATADRKTIRDAYFALSKRFHPDVYFKRQLGPYRERIDAIFRAFTEAYDVLGNNKHRAQYDKQLAEEGVRVPAPPVPPMKLTPPAFAIPNPDPRMVTPRPATVSPENVAIKSATVSSQPGSKHTPPAPFARPVFPEGVVVPDSIRGVVEASGPRPMSPPSPSRAPGPVDPVARQKALEAMARRLGGSTTQRTTVSSAVTSNPLMSTPAPATNPQAAEERAAKFKAYVARADEAQKTNNLPAALEALKSAQSLQKDDQSIKARIDAISQLISMAQVTEHIEAARQASRDRQFEKAATHWEKAWEGRKEDLTLLLNAADVLSKTREYKRAAELAQRALGIDPKLTKALVILAISFTESGLKASARSAIENLARLEPTHASLKELREKLGPMSIAEQFGLRGSR
jgi:hypothetical protein